MVEVIIPGFQFGQNGCFPFTELTFTLFVFSFCPPLFHQTKCQMKRGRDNVPSIIKKNNADFITISDSNLGREVLLVANSLLIVPT